jgi:esterase/lipase superfamily enzyme
MDLLGRISSHLSMAAGRLPIPGIVDFGSDGTARSKQTETIEPFKHYFRLDINQLYIAKGKEFWVNFDPLVYAAVDYKRGQKAVVASTIVGPKAIDTGKIPKPHGFVLNDIRVAGPVPFNGGDVGVTIILYKIAQNNYAQSIVKLMESVAASQTGIPGVSRALNLGSILLDGVQALVDLGENVPVMGQRFEINTSSLSGFLPLTRALIKDPGTKATLNVRDGRLFGEDAEFQESDFVLYSISKVLQRDDYRELPFFPLVKDACAAVRKGPDGNEAAKGILIALYNEMLKSEDLTYQDRERLFADFVAMVKQSKATVSKLGPKQATSDLRRGLDLIESSLTTSISASETIGEVSTEDPQVRNEANKSAPRRWVDDSRARRVNLLFATSRERSQIPGILFSGERGTEMAYGSLAVRVPTVRKIGEVNLPFELKLFNITIYKQVADPEVHFILEGCDVLPKTDWLRIIRSSRNVQALVFVHGFNVTFLQGVYRCAQISWDIGYTGIPILFSWASRGEIEDYFYDQVSARLAGDHFVELLEDLYKAGVTKVHVLAHSMGNALVLSALSRFAPRSVLGLGEVMMAAPDVDRDEYVKMVGQVRSASEGMTLYASSKDRALAVSKRLAGNIPRAGDVSDSGPILVDRVDAIDASALGTDIFGLNHGTFASSKSILNDVKRLLQDGTRPPPKRLVELRGMPEGEAYSKWWRYVF